MATMPYRFAHHADMLSQMAPSSANREDIKQFTLEEQVQRARRAAARMDAGYYFEEDELDNETLKTTPHRPNNENDEWL